MQKKILIGICDIGMGHFNRQVCIIDELLKYDVDLLLTYTDKNKELLDNKYPDLPKVKINIPWIACDNNGLNFEKCLEIYNNKKIDYYCEFLKFCLSVEKHFNGVPDYVFTDYECNVAEYAYARNLPLIGMEQQSKFLFLEDDDLKLLDKFNINEEISRLRFFFPKVDYRVISSFFPIKEIPNALLLPPIFNIDNKNKEFQDFILVYFSPYISDMHFFDEVYNRVVNDKKNKYIIYTKFPFRSDSHITIKGYSDDFKHDLEKCKCLITTAGHQLISEAIFLEKPMYLLPIDTFEQNYSSLMVKKYSLGKDINDNYYDFINNLDEIRQNMVNYKSSYWKDSWRDLLNNFFVHNLGLKLKSNKSSLDINDIDNSNKKEF